MSLDRARTVGGALAGTPGAGSGIHAQAGWSSSVERAAGWILLAIAVAMRVSYPSWIEFRGDEHEALAHAWRALHEGGLAHGFQSSNGIVLGPFFLLFFTPVVALTRDPVTASAWVMLWNLVALVALLALLRRAFGERPAVLATALFASLPVAAVYARKVWAPDMLLPLTFPLFLALLVLAERWRRGAWIAAVVLFALVAQVHPSAWFLAPGLLAFLWLARVRPPAKDLAIGAAIVLALYASYLLHELRTGFDDVGYVADNRPGSRGSLVEVGRLFLAHLRTSIDLTAPRLETLVGAERAALVRESAGGAFAHVVAEVFRISCGVATLASLALVAAGLVRGRLRGDSTRAGRTRLLFALVYVSVIAAYTLANVPAVAHYHVVLYPCVAFFLLDGLARILRGRASVLATAVVGVLVVDHAQLWWRIRTVALARPELEGGLLNPLPPAELEAVRRELPVYVDDALHREERWRAQQERQEERFVASKRVLLAVDVHRNEPELTGFGHVRVSPDGDGLAVTGSGSLHWLVLPAFAADDARPSILRLELTTPRGGLLIVFAPDAGTENYSRQGAIEAWVPDGRSVLHVELPAGAGGRLRIAHFTHRYVVNACEVRAIGE